jgi:hypothetical protein
MFWVFVFGDYYPGGGMNDFVGSYPTFEEAVKAYGTARSPGWDSVQIVEVQPDGTHRIVHE